jgi:hypothetical protein
MNCRIISIKKEKEKCENAKTFKSSNRKITTANIVQCKPLYVIALGQV